MDPMFSDFDSFSDSSSSDDQEDIESLYGGQARSIFSSLEETIEKIDGFLMFERGFLHGDIVSLVSDPSAQKMGKIVHVDMTVDLENIYGRKMHNIHSSSLRRIRSVSIGDFVSCGQWLGKVDKIVDRLTVLFDDGTKCDLAADDLNKIIPLSPDLIEDPQYPFYPGQRVKIQSSHPRSSRWLCGKDNKHEQGTVCDVDAGLVYVDWLRCAASTNDGTPLVPPLCLLDLKNLSLLPCSPNANWQLGDWCVIQNRDFSDSSFQQIGVIVKTKTKLDVQWQDGSQSVGLDSHLLSPVSIIDAHDFWPDSFVLEKGTVDDSRAPRWGFVRNVDPKERTVKVKWCGEEEIEEVVSAYELIEHPEYSYILGEAVFRSGDNGILDLPDEKCVRNGTEEEVDLKAVENSGDQSECISDEFWSCFGTVVGFENGGVEVKWCTGATTKVAPYEIHRVDKCEGTPASMIGDENSQPSSEEVPVKNQFLGQKLKDVFGFNDENAKDSSSPSISQVALGVFTSITSSLFGSLNTSLIRSGYGCTSEGGRIDKKIPEEEALELFSSSFGSQLLKIDDFEMPKKVTSLQSEEAIEEVVVPPGSEKIESFRQFDMVNDCCDHHFVNETGMDLQCPQGKRGWLKKVHQEWSILEKDLPETIYIRVYEEKISLLRAAIVGTAGTPYHDGLFFFDIYLPPQYPNEPPMVYYNSGGLRINPNLYESGKVCLSLLNTWSGSQSEVWNPKSSTILQVLLSLQALVLNEKPYFNEAGYDSQVGKVEGEKNSVSYNENAFLVSCRSMLYLLRRPPKHFEGLVDEHFSRRCRNILMACKAHMGGASIGHPFNNSEDEEQIHHGSSTGFKIMLTKLYPRLVEAFADKGFNCSDFIGAGSLK